MLIEMSHETYHAYVVHIQIVPSFLGLASSHYYNGIAFLLCGSRLKWTCNPTNSRPDPWDWPSLPRSCCCPFQRVIGMIWRWLQTLFDFDQISNEGAIFLSFVWVTYITLGANAPAVTNLMSSISWGFFVVSSFPKKGKIARENGNPLEAPRVEKATFRMEGGWGGPLRKQG